MDERITVTVGDDHLGHVGEVAEQLKAAGMKVESVLDTVGIITGSVASERRAALGGLSGVTAVEDEHTFQIAPPDAEVQ